MDLRTKGQSATKTGSTMAAALLAQKMKAMAHAVRRKGGQGAYPAPAGKPGPKSGHHSLTWKLSGRRALVTEAIRLGVLVTGKTPNAVGKVGVGQFRSWKTLAAAVERAQRAEAAHRVAVEEMSTP